MRVVTIVLFLAAMVAAPPAGAQPAERTLTTLEVAVACGPPPSLEMPSDPLRVIGAQDVVLRTILSTAEPLIINGGTAKGVQLGQQFYIRRPLIQGEDRRNPKTIVTPGWLRIVAVNETTAIAKLDHFCGAIFPGDYLEPFVAPQMPADYEVDHSTGELDFTSLSKVLNGPENTSAGAGGSLVVIDRGEDRDTRPGMRFAVYRDLHSAGIPLAAVGEGVVLSVGKTMSVTRIIRSRDTIVTGDYIVPRK